MAILDTVTLLSILQLSATVASLADLAGLLNRLVWAVAGLGLVLSILLGVTDSALRLTLIVPFIVTVPLVLVSINIWAWRHGDRHGGWRLPTTIPFVIVGPLPPRATWAGYH